MDKASKVTMAIIAFQTQKEVDWHVCETAIQALREKEERNNPKPLTLTQLKQMEWEAVWRKSLIIKNCCQLVQLFTVNDIRIEYVQFGSDRIFEVTKGEHGRICEFYAHKPKEV